MAKFKIGDIVSNSLYQFLIEEIDEKRYFMQVRNLHSGTVYRTDTHKNNGYVNVQYRWNDWHDTFLLVKRVSPFKLWKELNG